MKGQPDPTTHHDRVRATAVLLELAEDQGIESEIRLSAAQTILHAPVYDIDAYDIDADADAQDALADRIAEQLSQ